jgi:hypothetical protein
LSNREYRRKLQRLLNPIAYQEFLNDPVKFIQNMNPIARNILIKLMAYKNQYLLGTGNFKHLFMTQQTIADEIGVHKNTVVKWIDWLNKKGLLGIVYRGVKKSCLYYLHGIFLDPVFRDSCKDVMDSLGVISNEALAKSRRFLSFNGNGKSLPHGFFIGATATPIQKSCAQSTNMYYFYLKISNQVSQQISKQSLFSSQVSNQSLISNNSPILSLSVTSNRGIPDDDDYLSHLTHAQKNAYRQQWAAPPDRKEINESVARQIAQRKARESGIEF